MLGIAQIVTNHFAEAVTNLQAAQLYQKSQMIQGNTKLCLRFLAFRETLTSSPPSTGAPAQLRELHKEFLTARPDLLGIHL